MMRSKMTWTVWLLAMAMGLGCEAESKLNVVVEEGANAPHVNLPSVPTLPPPPPTNHSDGSLTVYGVRHLAARDPNLWGHQQRVHGFVVQVYVARNERGQPCTERDRCTEERPHIYIADSRDERDTSKWMQVTGYATFQYEIDQARTAARQRRPAPAPATPTPSLPGQPPGAERTVPTDFDEGAEVVVTGNFTRRAANGQADSNGLLEYTSHTTLTPAPPPTPARR